MEVSEARHRILVHAGFELDAETLGLTGRLRPFRGIDERDFADLVQALVTLHPLISNAPAVERDLVAALWSLSIESFSTRMLRGIELSQCVSHVLEYIASPELRSPQDFAFLLPILTNVAECDDEDVSETALRALEMLRK